MLPHLVVITILAAGMMATRPGVDSATAWRHAEAAALATGGDLDAAAGLLGQSWRESRWQPLGKLKRISFCGAMQTQPTPRTRARCVELWRDVRASYREGAAHLAEWRRACRSWGRSGEALRRCALTGYRWGGDRARAGSCRYTERVLRHAADLQRSGIVSGRAPG